MEYFTVQQLSEQLGISEGTIKKWLRENRLPNASIKSKVEGWRIPVSDLVLISEFKPKLKEKVKAIINIELVKATNIPNNISPVHSNESIPMNDLDVKNIIRLGFRAALLSDPDPEVLKTLAGEGLERAFEILTNMRQKQPILNYLAFIKDTIRNNHKPAEPIYRRKGDPRDVPKKQLGRKEITPDWLKNDKQYQEEASEAFAGDVEEIRRTLQEELKQYKKPQ